MGKLETLAVEVSKNTDKDDDWLLQNEVKEEGESTRIIF